MKKVCFILLMSVGLVYAGDIAGVSNGEVLVNGTKLDVNTKIKYGDKIETKKASSFRFKIGKEAFLVKENSKFSLKKEDGTNVFDLVSGSVMGVFAKGKHELKTPAMTAGIRGTGVYVEIIDNKTYFCTCYGNTNVDVEFSSSHEDLSATHHNMVWITEGKIKHTAKMEFHNDNELRVLEKMQGRVPAFDK